MNLPDIMRLDSKRIDQALEEALTALDQEPITDSKESDRHVGTEAARSERFMSFVAGSTMTMRDHKICETAAEERMARVVTLAFLAGWLAHARLEQPKWAENIAGRPI